MGNNERSDNNERHRYAWKQQGKSAVRLPRGTAVTTQTAGLANDTNHLDEGGVALSFIDAL